ncbi:MAG: hypothetical protein P4L44_15390 [Oryzomonas sp.]|uniref:hypothetical protein n=1 Tax=Oryzomonas sp. TaxID=2855186 RepID=UPI00284683B4|nr:hypothetical protein [Oryzomonas sp.]MDR3581343.1 hypothetical protein [Oryzomonas sp.]
MIKFVLAGFVGCFFLVGGTVCQAAKWDKNDFKDKSVEMAFYKADSIKVQGKIINLTEKYILTRDGAKRAMQSLSKYPACKQSIDKKGGAAHYQHDYQIEDGKARIAAIRFYNKDNEMLCTDKDMGKNAVDRSWKKIGRHSQMENIYYDLVTRYKIVVPK